VLSKLRGRQHIVMFILLLHVYFCVRMNLQKCLVLMISNSRHWHFFFDIYTCICMYNLNICVYIICVYTIYIYVFIYIHIYIHTYIYVHTYPYNIIGVRHNWRSCSICWCPTPRPLPHHKARLQQEGPCPSPAALRNNWKWCMKNGQKLLAQAYTWMSHVARMNKSCHTYDRVVAHVWMSYVWHMNELCLTYEWVMSHTWMMHEEWAEVSCSGICMNESCRTHMRHVTQNASYIYTWLHHGSRMNASCLTYK